jgi:hypothetical protein
MNEPLAATKFFAAQHILHRAVRVAELSVIMHVERE